MAMTERVSGDGHDGPRCGAKTRRGAPCRLTAGWGTAHASIGRCKLHGGSTPSHEVYATKVLAARADAAALDELHRLGVAEPITQPLLTLADLAGECKQWKEILACQVQSLSSLMDQAADPARVLPVVAAYERSLDRLGALLVSMGKLGIDETLGKRLARRQADLLTGCIRNILWRVGVNPADPEVGAIVAAEMRKVAAEERERQQRSLPGGDTA